MTANPTAPRFISPKTSSRSSPSPAGLRSQGLSAPAIHHADLDAGLLITEDFGAAGVIEGDPPAPIAERYEAATDMLAALHRAQLAGYAAAGAAHHLHHSALSTPTRC